MFFVNTLNLSINGEEAVHLRLLGSLVRCLRRPEHQANERTYKLLSSINTLVEAAVSPNEEVKTAIQDVSSSGNPIFKALKLCTVGQKLLANASTVCVRVEADALRQMQATLLKTRLDAMEHQGSPYHTHIVEWGTILELRALLKQDDSNQNFAEIIEKVDKQLATALHESREHYKNESLLILRLLP